MSATSPTVCAAFVAWMRTLTLYSVIRVEGLGIQHVYVQPKRAKERGKEKGRVKVHGKVVERLAGRVAWARGVQCLKVKGGKEVKVKGKILAAKEDIKVYVGTVA